MQKLLRSSVTAIVSGLGFFLGSVYILMEIGLSRYDNYEYYGQYPALYVVPGLVGLFLPALVAWLLRRSQARATDAEGSRYEAMTDTPDLEVARRVLLMLRELHQMGYERLRAAPGMSPSGCHWRCSITPVTNIRTTNGARVMDHHVNVARYTSANGSEYYGWDDAANDTARQLAGKFVERFPEIAELGKGSDPEYVSWYAEMLEATGPTGFIYAYADDWGLPDDRILALNGVEVPMPPPGEG